MTSSARNEVERHIRGESVVVFEGKDPLTHQEVLNSLDVYVESPDSLEIDTVSIGRTVGLSIVTVAPMALGVIAFVWAPLVVAVTALVPLGLLALGNSVLTYGIVAANLRKRLFLEARREGLKAKETKDLILSLSQYSKSGMGKSVGSIFAQKKAYAMYESQDRSKKIYYELVYKGLKVTQVNRIVETNEESVWDDTYATITKANFT